MKNKNKHMGSLVKLVGDVKIDKPVNDNETRMIDIELIDENTDNEKIFSMDRIDELVKSIKKQGFVGALDVMKKENGRYEVISGHRRLRALKELDFKKVRCFIIDYDLAQQKIKATESLLLSNLTNRDITTMQRSNAVQYYYDNVLNVEYPDLKQEEKREKACEFFSMKPSTISLMLSLQTLNDKLRSYANMSGFPVIGFTGTKRMTEEQIDSLVKAIEEYPGFTEYKNNEEDCPLSTRQLKALVRNILDSSNKENIEEENCTNEDISSADENSENEENKKELKKFKTYVNGSLRKIFKADTKEEAKTMILDLSKELVAIAERM